MPFLNAEALETDPDGMAFLRAVIRPTFAQEEAASPPVSRPEPRRAFQVPLPSEGERTRSPVAATPEAVPAA
jgi:hypothetical protein